MKNQKKLRKGKTENKNSGITLIALIVTIVILLILAGISIAMLSGDNSILGQAGNAKTQTDIAQEKEILQTASLAAISKEKYGDLTKEKLDDELDVNIGSTNYSSNLVDGGISVTFIKSGRTYSVDSDGNVEKIPEATGIAELTVAKSTIYVGETTQLTTTLEPAKSIGTVQYSSSDNTIATVSSSGEIAGVKEGTVTITATVNGASKTVSITVKKLVYAVDKLVINGSSSPYVNYPAKDGSTANKILCQVIYDKNSANGLQIISVEPVRKVTLGYGDEKITGKDYEEKALNSYNRAIETLNEYAEDYKDTKGIASDARCVGSDPRPGHKNDESEMIDIIKKYGTISFKDSDTHYTTDDTALSSIGADEFSNKTYGDRYWLATRYVAGTVGRIRNIRNYGGHDSDPLVYADINTLRTYSEEKAFRPVFMLNSGVKITDGTGTKNDPYEIDI